MITSENFIWYHGSPHQITHLLAGSTITQDQRLAEVFSHKPTLVSIEDDGRIRHNGKLPGYLYVIAEPIHPDDLSTVPHSSMEPGKEFLTKRELMLQFTNLVEVNPNELLLPEDINALKTKKSMTRSK